MSTLAAYHFLFGIPPDLMLAFFCLVLCGTVIVGLVELGKAIKKFWKKNDH